MSTYDPHRNNECGDLHLYRTPCTNKTRNCEAECGMPGLDATIESDGSRDKPGCKLNDKGMAMRDAYKDVVYPDHKYQTGVNSAGEPVWNTINLKGLSATHGLLYFRGGNDKPVGGLQPDTDYLTLKEWRAALAEEVRLRNQFEETCIWKRTDKQFYTRKAGKTGKEAILSKYLTKILI